MLDEYQNYSDLIDELFFKCFPNMSSEDRYYLSYTDIACKILNYNLGTTGYNSTSGDIEITLNEEVRWTPEDSDGFNFHKILWQFIGNKILKIKLNILTEVNNG